MTYVLSIYYIAWGARYDGSGNTDTATIRLFLTKELAVNAAVNFVREQIEEQTLEGVRDSVEFNEGKLREDVREGFHNFEDLYMITLEKCQIEG